MSLSQQQLNDFWSGIKASLPTMLGYISIGAAFGTIAGQNTLLFGNSFCCQRFFMLVLDSLLLLVCWLPMLLLAVLS